MNNAVAKRLRKIAIVSSPPGRWKTKYRKLKKIYVPMPKYRHVLQNLIKQKQVRKPQETV